MPRITVNPDCGNSPKNLFVQNLTTAYARGDIAPLLAAATDDIRWNIVGQQLIEGKIDFAAELEKCRKVRVSELTIHHVLTHGRSGAVNGTMKLTSGETYEFCDIYEFGNAKATSVRAITSYVIKTG